MSSAFAAFIRLQASKRRAEAMELEAQANDVEFADFLTECSLIDGQIVEYEGNLLQVKGCIQGTPWGRLVRKDGGVSDVIRKIYNKKLINKIEQGELCAST